MKKLLFALLIFVTTASFAQVTPPYNPKINSSNWWLRGKFDTIHIPVRSCLCSDSKDSSAELFVYSVDSSLYLHYLAHYIKLGGSGGGTIDTSSLSHRIDQRLLISDTAAMLANYLTNINLIPASGDLSGTYPNPTVAQFNGQLPAYYLNYLNLTNKPTIPTIINLVDTAYAINDSTVTIHRQGGVTWNIKIRGIGGGTPTGTAGGDLNGTYPNPVLITVNSSAGTHGDAASTVVVTYDSKGRTTAWTVTPIQLPDTSKVTGLSVILNSKVSYPKYQTDSIANSNALLSKRNTNDTARGTSTSTVTQQQRVYDSTLMRGLLTSLTTGKIDSLTFVPGKDSGYQWRNGTKTGLAYYDNSGAVNNNFIVWSAVKTANYAAVNHDGILQDNASGNITDTLPLSSTVNDSAVVTIRWYSGSLTNLMRVITRGSDVINASSTADTLRYPGEVKTFQLKKSTGQWIIRDGNLPNGYFGTKNNLITLNTSGTSGAAVFHRGAGTAPDTLYIPNYSGGASGNIMDTLVATVAANGNDTTAIVGQPNFPFKTINAALTAIPSSAYAVIKILVGTFKSPDSLHFRPNVTFIGSGTPDYADTVTINQATGNYTTTYPKHMKGGTILNGTFQRQWWQGNIKCSNFGIDVGPDWCNTFNGGQATNGVFFPAEYNLSGGMSSADGKHRLQDSLTTGIVFKNVSVLLMNDTCLFHAFLMEDQFGTIVDGCTEKGGFAGFVNKCIGSIYTGNAGSNNSVASFMFKDNDYSRCIGNTFNGFSINGNGVDNGLIFSSGVDLGSKSVLGCIAIGGNIYNCVHGVYTDGTPATAVSQYCNVSNTHIHKGNTAVYMNWSNSSLNNIIADSASLAAFDIIITQGGSDQVNNCIANSCGYGDSLNASSGTGNILYNNVVSNNSTIGKGFYNFGNVFGLGMYAFGNAGGDGITGAYSPIPIILLGGETIPSSGLNTGEIYGNSNAISFTTGTTVGWQAIENGHISGVTIYQDDTTKATWAYTMNSGGADLAQIARRSAGAAGTYTFPATWTPGSLGIFNSAPSATLTIGQAGVKAGTFSVGGLSSGTITFTPQAAAGTYNWLWPITVGNLGQLLQTGFGSAAEVWATVPYLITSTSVNAKNTGATALVTVPAGKTLTITSIVVHVSASSAITSGATASIDSSSTANFFFPATAMTALTASPKNFTYIANGMGADGVAGTVVNFDVTAGATGTSQTLSVDLFGYFK